MKSINIEERNKMVEKNIRLVPYTVDKFFIKRGKKKSEFAEYKREDFISEGYIELIKAVETFDFNKNISFSTYACTCIENRILNIIKCSSYDKRKANISTASLEFEINEDEEKENTLLDILTYNQDYSVVYSNIVLDVIDSFNIKDARFIIEKKMEGYTYKAIGKMLDTSGGAIYKRVRDIQRNLKKKEGE